jgi:adenylate cyclase
MVSAWALRHASALRWLALGMAAACVLLLSALSPGFLARVDERSGDLLWRWSATADPERRLVIVDIDDASLAEIGAWPWPRATLAQLVRGIQSLEPSALALDMVFPESRDGDALLAGRLQARPPVALAQILALDGSTVESGSLQGAVGPKGACSPVATAATGFIGNATGLFAPAAGHITPFISPDGAVRQLPAHICWEQRNYQPLVLSLLDAASGGQDQFALEAGAGLLGPAYVLRHQALPTLAVPVDAQGHVRVPYKRKREAFVSVSARDVLAGRAPAALFKGALVLVGATAFGLGDAVPTPHGGAVSGVEVHAQFLSGLLDGHVPETPRTQGSLQLLMALAAAAALLGVCAAGRVRAWVLPAAGVVLVALLFGVHAYALLEHDVWLGWATPASFALLASALLAVAEHARVRLERERLYRNLAAYLPEPVAARIALSEVKGVIEAERREITVLFADIRNFSAYCEGRPPEEAAAMLHVFFSTATRVVEAQQGVIEEFVGDAIMAVWNAPATCADHPKRAFDAALALLADTRELFPDQGPPGLEPLALGIGIETGQALVGSFGPSTRRTHGALGDTVTIASRLTGLTADLAQPILIGEAAAARLQAEHPDVALSTLGVFLLEGLRRTYQIFAPRPGSGAS